MASSAVRKPRYTIRPGSPERLLVIVPYLLGFMPQSSIVVMGTEPSRDSVQLTLRYGLPDSADPENAASIAKNAAAILAAHHLRLAAAVGYGPAPLVTPLADALRHEAEKAGTGPAEMILRAEDGRYWSYSSQDPDWFPAEGTPFDPSAHPDWAVLSAAEGPVPSGRDALAASIAPVTGPAAESMRRATRRAWRYHASRAIANLHKLGNPAAAEKATADKDLAAVREFIATHRDGRHATDHQVARLTVVLSNVRVRDDAWARMDPDYRDSHLQMWTDVVRRAQPGYIAAPASLLAFVAWQAGEGALANIALDRALADDPGYAMAKHLRKITMLGAPSWMARLPMTPEEVAAHYRDLDEAG